ncbi:MAG: hypothetical protein WAN10_16460 [Candidatus Acidiferrales bacterium]
MNAESRETELKFTSDCRLRAGVRAALEYIGERHGLTKEELCELAAAVEKECIKTLEIQKEPCCDMKIDEREDRIEVTVGPAREPDVPASHVHTGGAAGVSPIKAAAEAKDLNCAPTNGQLRATLVRHCHKNPAHP